METKKNLVQYLLIILSFFLIIFISASVQAATHYVSPSGSDTWENSTNIATPCLLSTANANADDDDIVYLRGGDYTSQRLIPANSGSSGHVITFARYQNETPSFTYDYGPSVSIGTKSYILIDGLTFADGERRQLFIYNTSSYIEVKNCTFGGNEASSTLDVRDSSYIYVHNNTFNAGADTLDCNETDTIHFERVDHSRMIDNDITDGGGHSAILLVFSHYNVIRGNTITLTSAKTNECGDGGESDVLDTALSVLKGSHWNLVESNILHDEAGAVNSTRTEGLKNQSSSYVIWRKNIIYNWDRMGWGSYTKNNYGDLLHNTIYNNTFYDVGNGEVSGTEGAFNVTSGSGGTNHVAYNEFKNNIVHTSWKYGLYVGMASSITLTHDNYFGANILFNIGTAESRRFAEANKLAYMHRNYSLEFGTDLTSDPKLTDPANGDMTLQSSSPAIDAGSWLTTITSATGSGVQFIVANPYYFYSGWGIPGETGDTIKTQNKKTATIISINYSTGQIRVDKPINWTNGEGIALNYQGTRPDIGAVEYSSDLSPPKGLVIITQPN